MVFLLGGIAALGSAATQLLVPALPLIARDLAAGAAEAQLVIGAFLVAMGLGQLACGPLADRFGRKHLLLAGLALFCLGSLLAALAPVLPVLLAGRCLQALGAAAGIVTARLMLGDLFPPEQAAQAQASLMGIVLVSPVLAPVIGGQLAEWLGWWAVLLLLAGAGAAGLMLAAARLPAPTRSAPRHRPALRAAYGELFRNRAFLSATCALAAGSAGLYMFLGFAPFILQELHGLSPRDTGLCLMLVALASMGGTRLVRPVERNGDALLAGCGTALGGSLLLAIGAVSGSGNLAWFIGPVVMLGLAAGLTGPAAIARVLHARPGLEGTATSLAGAVQMGSSAAAGYALGHAGAVSTMLLAMALVPTALLGCLAAIQSSWLQYR